MLVYVNEDSAGADTTYWRNETRNENRRFVTNVKMGASCV